MKSEAGSSNPSSLPPRTIKELFAKQYAKKPDPPPALDEDDSFNAGDEDDEGERTPYLNLP